MKNQYMIVKYTNSGNLYYNEDFNIFTVKHGTIFTNKKRAIEKMIYACKYASGCEIEGKTEVIRIN